MHTWYRIAGFLKVLNDRADKSLESILVQPRIVTTFIGSMRGQPVDVITQKDEFSEHEKPREAIQHIFLDQRGFRNGEEPLLLAIETVPLGFSAWRAGWDPWIGGTCRLRNSQTWICQSASSTPECG